MRITNNIATNDCMTLIEIRIKPNLKAIRRNQLRVKPIEKIYKDKSKLVDIYA